MNHQSVIKASVQDVVETQEFRTTEVPNKESRNKWERNGVKEEHIEYEI